MSEEEELIKRNRKLLTKGDDSEIECSEHNCKKRWGDLDPLTQLAVLAGLDIEGDTCIMELKSGK